MDHFFTTTSSLDLVGRENGLLLDSQETGPIVYKDSVDSEKEKELRATLYMSIFNQDNNEDLMNSTSMIANTSLGPPAWATFRPPPLNSASIVAIILGVLGLIANVSTLIAIARIRISLTANLRLIVSLCSSDMLVSISILLKLLHKRNQFRLSPVFDSCLDQTLRGIRMTSHIVSLLNLVGLALDHYFAIIKPLKYPLLMRKRYANLMILSFWAFSAICGFSDFIIPSRYYSYCERESKDNYCLAVQCSVFSEEYIMFTVAFISCVLMVVLYTIIFIQITRYQNFQQMFRQNMKRNRRGLITTFVIVATFMITWLPYCLFDVIQLVSTKTKPEHIYYYFRLFRILEWHFYNLLLLNSLLDPIIYAIRMREVQNGYKNSCRCLGPLRRQSSGGFSMSGTDKRGSIRQATMSTAYVKPCQSESYV